ncbi:hypothetical protein Tco_1240042 [Tanacetum coccineum]
MEKIETVQVSNKKRTEIVIKKPVSQKRGVYKESKEGTLDHSKKLKGIKTLSSSTQYLVDMKKPMKASKDNFILKQHTKGPDEGSGVIPEVPDGLSDSSDSSSSKSKDEERFLSTNDEANQAKFDDERTKIDDSEKAKDVKDAYDQAGEEQ